MDIGTVERITADAVGDPGERTFYLQARSPAGLVTIVVEKQQVQLLAASVLEILANLGLETGTGPNEDELSLEDPVDPRWRAGKLSIGYDQDRDLFMLEIEEFVPEPEDELEEDDPARLLLDQPEQLRLWATRDQMFALSRHGAAVAERGRPTCQFCGNPLGEGPHACPAMNGHSRSG